MLWGGEEIAMVGKKQSSGRSEPRAEAETASGRRRRPKRGARGPKEATPARIQSWVDDPASPWGLMERPAPVLDARPWAFSISGEAIPVGVYLATDAGWFASETGVDRHAVGTDVGYGGPFSFVPDALRSLELFRSEVMPKIEGL